MSVVIAAVLQEVLTSGHVKLSILPACRLMHLCAEDAAVLAAAGTRIVHGPAANPFRSLAPLLDSRMGPDRDFTTTCSQA
jgi:hypothetical protein